MARRVLHEARARHDEDLCAHLQSAAPSVFCDWEVTGLFYAAVHWVDAFLDAALGVDPAVHYEPNPGKPLGRNQLVQRHLHPIYGDYRRLYTLSRVARYQAHVQIGPSDVADAQASLRRVKAEVSRRLP